MNQSSVVKLRSSSTAIGHSDVSLYKNIEADQAVNMEIEKKVKTLKISDYFKNKKLQIKSTLRKRAVEKKREGFMNQIKSLH